jgi:hypothetical protein
MVVREPNLLQDYEGYAASYHPVQIPNKPGKPVAIGRNAAFQPLPVASTFRASRISADRRSKNCPQKKDKMYFSQLVVLVSWY